MTLLGGIDPQTLALILILTLTRNLKLLLGGIDPQTIHLRRSAKETLFLALTLALTLALILMLTLTGILIRHATLALSATPNSR